jgi:bifunctional DNase/RNase
MVEVIVAKLGLDSSTNSHVVILQEKDGHRLLPIWIGQPEADSIVMEMKNVRRERPLTHDLCKNIIVGLGGTLRRVQITKVAKSTYYAELHVARPDGMIQIDARPSDSIAIALRLSAPIFAQESLLTAVAEESDGDDNGGIPGAAGGERVGGDELTSEQLKERLENLRPEDLGKFNI